MVTMPGDLQGEAEIAFESDKVLPCLLFQGAERAAEYPNCRKDACAQGVERRVRIACWGLRSLRLIVQEQKDGLRLGVGNQTTQRK